MINASRSRSISSYDGTKLWVEVREVGAPIWLILTHGVGEHSGRHNYLFDLFPDQFNILLYDLRGHGKSWSSSFINFSSADYSFDYFEKDLHSIIEFLHQEYRMQRFILMGHSMGAIITASFMQKMLAVNNPLSLVAEHIHWPEKVILSAPPVKMKGLLGNFLNHYPKLTERLTKLPISIPFKGAINLHKLSHDGRIFENYIHDNLNRCYLPTGLLTSIVHNSNQVFSRPIGLAAAGIPLAVAIGKEDQIVDANAVKNYFSKVEVTPHLLVVEGAYHELHNEVQRYRRPYTNFLGKFLK